MAKRKPLKDPEDLFECGSYVFRDDRGLMVISLPPNLIEKLGIKKGDGFIWKDYYQKLEGRDYSRRRLHFDLIRFSLPAF